MKTTVQWLRKRGKVRSGTSRSRVTLALCEKRRVISGIPGEGAEMWEMVQNAGDGAEMRAIPGKSGRVCNSGLGEACSHISAILFTLDANVHAKKSMFCTSMPCSWLPSSFKIVPFAPTAKIDCSAPDKKLLPILHMVQLLVHPLLNKVRY